MKNTIAKRLAAATVLSLTCTLAWPADPGGGILRDEAAPDADANVLLAEAKLFDSIRKGVALSLAECDLQSQPCDPAVNREELKQVMDKLDNRINLLAARHDQTGEKSLEDVLLTYANVRDDYKQFMEKLDKVAPAQPEDTGENVFDLFGTAQGGTPKLPDAYNVFEDADQPIKDDDTQPGNAPDATQPQQQ